MSPNGETEVVLEKPKRVVRKRTPKVVSGGAAERAPIKRVSPARTRTVSKSGSESEATARRAPTPIASEIATKKKSRRQWVVVAGLILVGVGASAIVGFTDDGQINVTEVIEYRNEQARASGNIGAIIPVQNTSLEPDGGLMGLGIGGPEETTPASSTASSTDSTASSTEPAGSIPLTTAEAQTGTSESTEPPTEPTP